MQESVRIGMRFGDWLYMRTYHDGFHLFDGEMLFDVAKDPHERRNVAADHLAERKTAAPLIASCQFETSGGCQYPVRRAQTYCEMN